MRRGPRDVSGLSRRGFLAAATAAAAATGLTLEQVVAAQPASASGLATDASAPGTSAARAGAARAGAARTAARRFPTTLEETHLLGPRTVRRYRTLRRGPGEPFLPRLDLLGRAPVAGRAAARRSLAYIGHLSDVHVIDAQSPGRLEPLYLEGHIAGFHPQDPLSPHVVSAMVRSFSDLRYSPLTGAPMTAAVVTGDTADQHSHRELRWFIDLMDGVAVDPALGGREYQGLQAWAEAQWAYRPRDPSGGEFDAFGFPRLPRLLDQVTARKVESPGLPAPWYVIYGNHDSLMLGEFEITPQLRAMAIGGRKSFSLAATASTIANGYAASSGLIQQATDAWNLATGRAGFRAVPAHPSRRLFREAEFMAEHFTTRRAPGPVGHGFTRRNLETGETWWAADLSPHVRALGLDTCNHVAGANGAVPGTQLAWLQAQLERATRERRLVLVLTHHNSQTLDNRVQHPEDTEILYGAGALIELLHRYPTAVAWLNGHTHVNQILAHPRPGGGGFWEVTTASCIDFPQQQQVVELLDNRDGTLSIFTLVVDQAGPSAPSGGGDVLSLAAQSRELAANDWKEFPAFHRGSPLDRNTELLLPAPFDLSAITDASLEAQHTLERARVAVAERSAEEG